MDKKEHSQNIQIFSRNILWIRRHYGISRKRMAQLLNIGVGSLKKLEEGILPPRLRVDILFDIHRQFGISPQMVLGTLLEEQHNSPRL